MFTISSLVKRTLPSIIVYADIGNSNSAGVKRPADNISIRVSEVSMLDSLSAKYLD